MPDNAFYAHAAYIATAAIYGVYAVSVWRRRRRVERLRRELDRGGDAR